MCASAGRESSLREPSHYRLQFPHILVSVEHVNASIPLMWRQAPEDPKQAFTSHMIALAQLMDQFMSQEIYQSDDPKSWVERSSKCLDIDRRLIQWKSNLPLALDFDKTSLVEPEWVAKQKVVLRNRRSSLMVESRRMHLTDTRLLEFPNLDPPTFSDRCGHSF